MKELINLIGEKEKNVEELVEQFTTLLAKKLILIDEGKELRKTHSKTKTKITEYQNKLNNINNFEHDKKFTKICAIVHYVILTLFMTAILCLNFSNLTFLPVTIIFIASNLVSAGIMYCANKIIVKLLKKKIDPNYSVEDLNKIIKNLKKDENELNHQLSMNFLTITHMKKKLENLQQTINFERLEVRKLKNRRDDLLYPNTNNKPNTEKTKKLGNNLK